MRKNDMMDILKRWVSLALMATLLLATAAPTAQARFLNPDNWDPWQVGVDFNRYGYAGNDPINKSDPNGHVPIIAPGSIPTGTWGDAAIGLGIGAAAVGAFFAGPAIAAGYVYVQTSGAGAVMLGTELAAGEVGIMAPTAAGGALLGGKVLSAGEQLVAPAKRLSNITVLGKYPQYKDLSDQLMARRFDVPMSAWSKMNAGEQWAANLKYLDRMIRKGDKVRLASPVNQADKFYAKELTYLKSQGYSVSSNGQWMTKSSSSGSSGSNWFSNLFKSWFGKK